MASESGEPRPSTDREDAPLLDHEHNGHGAHATTKKSFSDHLNDIANEPMTTLAKILLVVALVFLLLTSVFIGLFAGAEHKLKAERRARNPSPNIPVTTIITWPSTTITSTMIAIPTTLTTTATTTATATTTKTTTTRVTSTVPIGPIPTGKPGQNLCTTPGCVHIAASILDGLDESKDPCENFYEFANGGWLSNNEIPSGKGSFASFDKLAQENKRIIRKIIEPSESSSAMSELDDYDKQNLKKLQDFYASCIDEDLLNDRGLRPLRDIVNTVHSLYRQSSGKFTAQEFNDVLPDVDANKVDLGLTSAISFLHSRGIGGLFDFDVDGDVGVDPNYMSLWFSQPGLGLPSKEYYEEDDIVHLYKHTLSRIIEALDSSDKDLEKSDNLPVSDTEEQVKVWPPWPWPPWGDDDDDKQKKKLKPLKMAKKIIKFEKAIANASLDLEDLYQDPIGTYNPLPFSEFASQLPQLHFPMYFSTFTPRAFPTRVIVTSKTYASSLSSILSSTPRDVIEAYLVTRAALALAPYLGKDTEVWQAKRSLDETLQGIKKGQVPERSDWCVQRVEEALGFASGRFFVEETFGGDSRVRGTKVITDIIDAFKASLKNLKWMDQESANAAAEKADAIRVKVGYPLSPNTENARSIALYYNLVIVDKKNFAENVLSSWISDEYKKFQRLGKQRDLEAWEMYPSMVNAYFNPPANEIVFPAGILRPPFFSKDWPAYLQYGAFGQVAAHELTHAFDSAGRLYNQKGKLEQWWTNATSEGFKEKQECIVNQYSNYWIDDGKGGKIHVNGNLTSGENIGDTGLIQAYRAWYGQFHTSFEQGREYLLPGLNYSQEQLFFIAFGQIWSQLIKPAAAVQRVRTDPHSPNQFRVDGTLFNIPEFAKAFQCKEGAKLNPPEEKRCRLW